MLGTGTLINAALVVAGGLVGLACGRFFPPRLQDALLKSTAVCILFVGIAGALEHMLAIRDGALASEGTMLIVVCMAAGSCIGELLNLELHIERFGTWLKKATGSAGDPEFVNAFVTASLTVSIGAMAIVGAIQDGLAGDWSVLALKGAIDAVLVCVMTASMGRGCIFSAVPVVIFEGGVTVLARLMQPIMTDAALANLSLVGSLLIFCVGVNLIWEKTFKPANMLPAVAIAVVAALV